MSGKMLLISLGIAIVLILGVIAAYYLLKVHQLQKKQQLQLAELKAQNDAQRLRVNRSIQIIAENILADQLSLTEGAIRIKNLLDGLAVEAETQESFAAFYHLTAATSHIPILDEWKALNTRQQMVFDKQRQQLESDHREFVLDAAQRVLGKTF
jgi:hypothetical protein